ncbi:MAG: hypothetical protein K2Y33_02385 [Mycolicibacterium frederiksbergense]|nr:hypothetical protein [Mycolicibacterium frederiksbergense]
MTATQASDTDKDNDRDSEDICSDPFEEGCTDSLDDGEGWNGACGNCADRQYAAEQDDEDEDEEGDQP